MAGRRRKGPLQRSMAARHGCCQMPRSRARRNALRCFRSMRTGCSPHQPVQKLCLWAAALACAALNRRCLTCRRHFLPRAPSALPDPTCAAWQPAACPVGSPRQAPDLMRSPPWRPSRWARSMAGPMRRSSLLFAWVPVVRGGRSLPARRTEVLGFSLDLHWMATSAVADAAARQWNLEPIRFRHQQGTAAMRPHTLRDPELRKSSRSAAASMRLRANRPCRAGG